ncbi:MAG: RNA polymerase sigma factor [Anaerolineae bacterium]|nr:RNA polymerase sigma factor [Anaerolineae bacterium]
MNHADPSWLISECIAGNEDAIETLVRQYETGVFKLAFSICNDLPEAYEIMQETFIAVLRSLRSYQEKKTFKAWLYTITINTARSHLRKSRLTEKLRKALTSIFLVEVQKSSTPEEAVIQNEKEAVLWRALNNLDERHRLVIVLKYFHELSVAEISQILSIREGTVHSRLHTARERLKDALEFLNRE